MIKIAKEYLMTAALFGLATEPGTNKRLRSDDLIEKAIAQLPKQKVLPKGIKPFVIDGVEVYALNKKNAIRKAKKQQHAKD